MNALEFTGTSLSDASSYSLFVAFIVVVDKIGLLRNIIGLFSI